MRIARNALLALALTGCEATLSTGGPSETPPAPEPPPSAEDVAAKKEADQQVKQAKDDEKSAAEEDKAYEEKLAKDKARSAAAEKAMAEAEAAKQKAHKDECAKSFPARLATVQAAIKKVPKACSWVIANCEQKKVAVTKKQAGETITYLESRMVCSAPVPAGVGDPGAWWQKNEAACSVGATSEDVSCSDVDPIRLSGTPIDEIAAFKS